MTEINAQLKSADQLFEENRFQETVDFLKTIDDQGNPEVLWRLGRAIFKVSGTESSSAKKDDLIRQSYKLLTESLEKDENNFAIHKWYAILLDANSNLGGIKERVQQLENVKKHMKRAIELNPSDPTSRYILGEFEFGLADLPWV
jgi:tetratricopeptide (TPR) repeat protein